MNLLTFLLRESRGAVLLSVVAGACSGACTVALIALIGAGLGRPATWPLAAAFAALCLVAALTRVVSQVAMARLAQGSVARLGLHLGGRVASLPLAQFEEIDPSALTAVLTEDIAIVAGALAGFPQVCINAPIVVACLTYIGWLSPTVLACWLVFAAPAVLVYWAFASRGARRFGLAREGHDALIAHFRSLIGGFRELKQHRGRREAFLGQSLRGAAESTRDHGVAALTAFSAAAGWGQVAYFGFVGFVLFVLPRYRPLGVEVLGGSALAILYIMTPLDVLLGWVPILGRARASLRKVESLLPELSDRRGHEAAAPASPPALRDAIRLEGVTYTYPGDPEGDGFVLGPIDLTLRPGELVVLAGGNGSGKTTLVKLLAGLYEPREGTISVDGRPVDGPAMREAYRQLFSVVFADGHLFEPGLGLDPVGLDGRAAGLLGRLGLAGRVRVEGGRFSTTDLSQGQRKRLALAVALLENRPACVFDEWAAHQDPHFKRAFYHEILPGLKAEGKALLVISHDEDYFAVADRVLKLEGGLVADRGEAVLAGKLT